MTWPNARLGDLCEINVGRTPARANSAFWGDGAPWLSIADMKQGREIKYTREQITPAGAAGGRRVAPGTVLLSFKLSIGKVGRAMIPLFTNEAIAALPVKRRDLISENFLMRMLEAKDLTVDSNRAAMGATLNKAKLKEVRIPVPPLPEQHRIAAILDHADALRATRRLVLAHLDILRQSVFIDMFGREDWSASLGELADVRTGPFGSLLHREDYISGGVSVINPTHIRGGALRPDPDFSVPESKASGLSQYRLQTGDVVLGRRGEMGRAGIAGENHVGMLCGTGSLILRPVDVDSRFLQAVVTSPRMRGHLDRSSLGATLANLNSGIVKRSPVPNVSVALQSEFAARVKEVEHAVALARHALHAVDALFAALETRAFTGELGLNAC